MARKKRQAEEEPGELNLTAMIDVAFQLLSFFIMVAHPIDVQTKLSVQRPMPDKTATKESQVKLLTVMVLPDRYIINQRVVAYRELEGILAKLAALDKSQTVLIECLNMSTHKQLVQLLDLCTKHGLTQLNVVSSGGA